MAVFSKDAVAAALDQLSETLDEAKGGGKDGTDEDKEDEGNIVNGVHAPQVIIPLVLEQYLERISKTGNALLPWGKLKPLIILKLEKVIENVTNEEEDLSFLDEKIQVSASDGSPLSGGDGDPSSMHILKMKKRIITALNNFHGIPFTIQRLCELLTQPKTYYKRIDKLLRGLEKNVRIVRTISPLIPGPPPPRPPVPINASLSASSASGDASNNCDSFIIKTTASTSSASTSPSSLSNLEKQEVNLPASSSPSFSTSALDPSQFATHLTKVVDGSNFPCIRKSPPDDGDVEMTPEKSVDDDKMDDGEGGGGGGCDDVSSPSNVDSYQNDIESTNQLTKFDEEGEEPKERVTVQLNSHEVAEIRGHDLSDATKDETGNALNDPSRKNASENDELASLSRANENGTKNPGVEKSGSEIHSYSNVDCENRLGADDDGDVDEDDNSASVSSDSLEEVAETETAASSELSSPMKRKRSIGAPESGEDEEEPPLKRNSPDIEEGNSVETKGREGDGGLGTELNADDSTVNGEQQAELSAA